ncbi:hypothetical protein T4B_7104 [Trichinella pseudospiralis]|uniref:Uncharacterized protein n=1 Tax=Trichinella pseudospiralis TaxID=6337 RepID=A0A0V1I6A2_TRIPS|nr:hypothetical protein T4B_7104 [Trichinella pseudospiralis]
MTVELESQHVEPEGSVTMIARFCNQKKKKNRWSCDKLMCRIATTMTQLTCSTEKNLSHTQILLNAETALEYKNADFFHAG